MNKEDWNFIRKNLDLFISMIVAGLLIVVTIVLIIWSFCGGIKWISLR